MEYVNRGLFLHIERGLEIVTWESFSALTNARQEGVPVILLPFSSLSQEGCHCSWHYIHVQGRKRGDEMVPMTFCLLQESKSFLRSLQQTSSVAH